MDRLSNQCLHNLTVNPTVQPTVESTVGPTVRPTVRSTLKPCTCAITLVGKLPVITGNWQRAVQSADAGLLVNTKWSNLSPATTGHYIKPHLTELADYLWSPYGIGQTIYIFMLWFVLSSSFFFIPRLISAAADWMSAILPHMVWP